MRHVIVVSLVMVGLLALPSTSQAFNKIIMTWEEDSDPSTRPGWFVREPTPGYYDDHWDKTVGQLNVVFDINVPTSGEMWWGAEKFKALEGSPTEQY